MVKIAFIGAGSVVFTKNLLTDVFARPDLHGVTIALHDIDAVRLKTSGMMARWTADQLGAEACIKECPERRAALDGADYVINTVQIGGHAATLLDFEIPRRYGLKQTVGDTLGIGGIFRALRTIPFMLDLAAEMGELCPRALLLNYTNPLSMLVWAVYRAYPRTRIVGLCHSVQSTTRQVAAYIDAAPDDLHSTAAGINHIAWLLRIEVGGEDVYPRLRAAMDDPAVYAKDKVRFELLRHFGYFVTESSHHSAEYTPYFLRRDELIERFDVLVDAKLRGSEKNLAQFAETRRQLLAGEPFPLEPSDEYAARIIEAEVTGRPCVIYGNVENTGLVTNLPDRCCVEVPVLVDRSGLRSCHVGALPPQLAANCLPHVTVQDLVVRAILEGRREHVYHAALLDRLAASVLSLDEIHAMVDELLAAHRETLPDSLLAS